MTILHIVYPNLTVVSYVSIINTVTATRERDILLTELISQTRHINTVLV